MADWMSELLCPLPYRERIVKAHGLLADAEAYLTGEERSRAAYFIAHAHRQLRQPSAALEMCQTAIDWPMPAHRRIVLVECQAMSLYDLGRFGSLETVLATLERLELPESVRAHAIVLRGCMASYNCDPVGFQHFHQAADLLSSIGYEGSLAWVQRSAASLALKTGDAEACLDWAKRITHGASLPVAQLLSAEALTIMDRQAESEELLADVADGKFGALESEAQVRIWYLGALHLVAAGRYAEADSLLGKACAGFADLQRQDIDLCDAINRLRNRLRRGEVARK